MKLKGKFTISLRQSNVDVESFVLSVEDSQSSTTFLEVAIRPEDLSRALAGRAFLDCDLTLRGLDRVGKVMEVDHITADLPAIVTGIVRDKEAAQIACQKIIDEDGRAAEGWVIDKAFNSQNSFTYAEGKRYCHTTIRRYVDPEDAAS